MPQIRYTATFSNGATVARTYAKPLAVAYKYTYCLANDASETSINGKTAFSGSRELAEKAMKLPKRLKLLTSEIVDTVAEAAPAKAEKTPRKPKPFTKGDAVSAEIGGAVINGLVHRIGSKYTYITAQGALNEIKVATTLVAKAAMSLAIAA